MTSAAAVTRARSTRARGNSSSSPALHEPQNDNYSKQWSVVPRSPRWCQWGSFELAEDGCGIGNADTRLRGPALALSRDVALCCIDTAGCLKAAWGFLTQRCSAPWNHDYDSERAARKYLHLNLTFCGCLCYIYLKKNQTTNQKQHLKLGQENMKRKNRLKILALPIPDTNRLFFK